MPLSIRTLLGKQNIKLVIYQISIVVALQHVFMRIKTIVLPEQSKIYRCIMRMMWCKVDELHRESTRLERRRPSRYSMK